MFSDEWYDNPVIIALTIVFSLAIITGIPGFYVAKKTSIIECRLYNEKYGTKYTPEDFFWSGETIKSFLNTGKQTTQNLNINGAIPVKISN